jgi:hypothetical protein
MVEWQDNETWNENLRDPGDTVHTFRGRVLCDLVPYLGWATPKELKLWHMTVVEVLTT